MVSPAPNPNEVVCELPSRVKFLGDALEPVARNLRQSIACKIKSVGHEFVTLDDLSRHMGVISQALTHLEPRLTDLIGSTIDDERASMADAYRAAGRLEQVLSEFVDGYHDVKASHAGPEARQARSLLLGVYRHHIRNICEWLDELVKAIADPASAIEQRRIPLAANVVCTVSLNMTSPPEMVKLNDLVTSLQMKPTPIIESESEPEPRYEPPQNRGPGVLGTLGALAFGVGINRAIWGRHRG